MKKNIIIAVLATLVGAFIILMIVGLIANNQDSKIESSKPIDSFKEAYMQGCTEEGASITMCDCSYNQLLKDLGMDGLIDLSADIAKGEEIPEYLLNNMIEQCL